VVTRARDAGPPPRELEHTADVGFEVEAPTLAALFERAGLAVVALMLDATRVEPRETRPIVLAAEGRLELLHDWLQRLVIDVQTGGIAPGEIAVERIDDTGLAARVAGERLDPVRHGFHTEVKAVTWHELAVEPRGAGWWARVIVDV
jgi:SHS2 domain-containing protein